MEPIMGLAAGAILKLAVDEAVKAGAGEAAKQAVTGVYPEFCVNSPARFVFLPPADQSRANRESLL